MAPALAFVLASTLGAPWALQAESGVRLEERTLHGNDTAQKEPTVADLVAAPHLLLKALGEGSSAEVGYDPRFTAREVGTRAHQRVEQMHEGHLQLQYAPAEAFHLAGIASGGMGRIDLAAAPATDTGGTSTGPPSTVPTVRLVDMKHGRLGLDLRAVPDRRSLLLVSGGLGMDGGTNGASREALPTEHVTDGTAEYRWSASRLDQVGLRAAAQRTKLPSLDSTSSWASALALWRRRAMPALDLWAGAGAVDLYSRVPAGAAGTTRRLEPAAELGAATVAASTGDATAPKGQPLMADALLRLGAGIDRLTGEVSRQLEGSAGGSWAVDRTLTLSARTSGALAWQRAGRSVLGRLDTAATWAATARVHLELGLFGSWQHTMDAGTSSYSEVGVSMALVLEAPNISL